VTPDQVIEAIRSAAEREGVDPRLATAIALVESGGDPLAIRFEPNWKYFYQPEILAHRNRITQDTERVLQSCSYGALQVIGAVVREQGFQGTLMELAYRPELAIHHGVKKLKSCLERFGSVPSAIAAYNAGTPRKIEIGPGAGVKFVNQDYVTKVLSHLDTLTPVA